MKFLRKLFSEKAYIGEGPYSIKDRQTGLQNQTLSIGRRAILMGKELSFDPQDQRRGIFLVDNTGRAKRATAYEFISENMVKFIVPKLKTGKDYDIMIKSLDLDGHSKRTWLSGELTAV